MDDKTAIKQALAYVPQYFEFQREYMPFVGAQVAVRVDGELIFNEAFGYADLADEKPLTTEHLFRIASHSKTFTGVAIMQLVEQGKLRLDDEAQQYVPELKGSPMGSVTVRELLAHGSGMTRDGDDSTFWALNRPFPDREELLQTIREDGKVLEPNEHFKYSNIGYSLLGLIIEGASGVPYREYVTTNIVDRLGLENTGPELRMDRIDDYAKGYSVRAFGPNRIEIDHIDTFEESSATGFYSTAADVTAYFQAHLDGNDTILSDGSKRRMRQVQWTISDDAQYGLGLSITRVNGRTYYGHSGGYPGHITMSKFDPDRKLSISVLTNAADGPAADLCIAILHLIDLALDSKHEAKTDPQPDEKLAPFTGRFAGLWGILDVVNLGGRLYLLAPTSDNPAAEATEMEVVSDTGLKCVGDKGFGGYGEVMRYTFDENGRVSSIRGTSGARMIPIEEFVLPEKVTRPYDPASITV
ncbi:MAG TPA: serine hydrolase domain-containing protein [Thermomicrobiales bacterium]|nr:serine hydrolase domain-containing protein [Thermomicrobiales bacterium]